MRMRYTLWTSLFCIGFLAAGCEDSPIRNFITGKTDSEFVAVPEKNANATPSTTSAPATSTDTSTASATDTRYDDDAKVPDDFPKDVPLYKGAKLVMTEEARDRKSFKVQSKSTDAIELVSAYFDHAVQEQEWKIDERATDTKDSGLLTLGFTKDEDRFLSVTLLRNVDGDGLSITVATGYRKKEG